MTFVDICSYLPLYLIFIVGMRFVNHLLNYYLLTYLPNRKLAMVVVMRNAAFIRCVLIKFSRTSLHLESFILLALHSPSLNAYIFALFIQ